MANVQKSKFFDDLKETEATMGQITYIGSLLRNANLTPEHIDKIDYERFHYTEQEAEKEILYLRDNQVEPHHNSNEALANKLKWI